jgi:hypothetical protein
MLMMRTGSVHLVILVGIALASDMKIPVQAEERIVSHSSDLVFGVAPLLAREGTKSEGGRATRDHTPRLLPRL